MAKKVKLNREEQAIEDSLERGEWKPVSKRERQKYKKIFEAAADRFKKEARMNIRMSQLDMDMLRAAAENEGMGYQTLVSSILHKYVTGQFVEKKNIADVVDALAENKKQAS